ncbi:hypothetical protein BpHYR1_007470 [Brachionus plicatilis]|uniref:Uncharacterized protein n=1 Tax=Brachionus plicatilis TaxID=10195 RepID=A0A3M7Q591_BRAPC|nr:hypothetical protein BpHYR1_007470 [Brachionus plicatilis]
MQSFCKAQNSFVQMVQYFIGYRNIFAQLEKRFYVFTFCPSNCEISVRRICTCHSVPAAFFFCLHLFKYQKDWSKYQTCQNKS